MPDVVTQGYTLDAWCGVKTAEASHQSASGIDWVPTVGRTPGQARHCRVRGAMQQINVPLEQRRAVSKLLLSALWRDMSSKCLLRLCASEKKLSQQMSLYVFLCLKIKISNSMNITLLLQLPKNPE